MDARWQQFVRDDTTALQRKWGQVLLDLANQTQLTWAKATEVDGSTSAQGKKYADQIV